MPDTINGRTPEEIKKGLECCSVDGLSCSNCSYCVSCDADIHALERDALAYIQQLESAQSKWISVIDNPPDEGDVVFVHDPDEGWIALVKVIQVNLASIDVKAIWPEHSPPFIAKVWTPLRLPEPPKEEV